MSQFDQRRAFLDEVLAHPEDDAPRLIYADYLEELGDPRGEFIRLQCELAALDQLDPRYLDVSHRCDELLFQHRQAWASELKQDVRKSEFSRGFIDKITIRARAFIKEADALYQSTPVHWLRFNYVKGVGAELAATQALANVRSLDLSGLVIPDADLIALLMSPQLSNLEALNLAHYDSEFSQSVGAALGEMPATESIRDLDLPGGAEFLRAVSSGGGFPSLQHLAVGTSYSENDFAGLSKLKLPKISSLRLRGTLTVADCEAVAALPLAQLKKLDLESTRIPGKGLQIFADRGAFDEVAGLNLAGCDLRVRGAGVLFQGDRLRNCTALNLSRNANLARGKNPDLFVQSLVGHQVLSQLKHLHLCGLNPQQVRRVGNASPLRDLELLEFESSELDSGGLSALAASPIAESLRQLKLIGCSIDPATIRQLSQSRAFPNLLRLDLGGGYDDLSTFNEAIVIGMVTSPAFANVQAINLDYMLLSSTVLTAIAERANLPELRQISYCNNRASRKSVDTLMNSPRLPKLSKLILSGTSGLTNRDKLIADYGSKVQF